MTGGTPPILSRYTLLYAGAGAGLRRWGFTWTEAAAVAIAWEVAQRPLKEAFPNVFPDSRGDTLTGATADVLAVLGGWWILGELERLTAPRPGA